MPDPTPDPVVTRLSLGAALPRLVAGHRAILADLDGSLISGDTVLPDVEGLFAQAGLRLWIVSNNSSDTAMSLSTRLAGHGLAIPPDRILLAGEQTLVLFAENRPGARIALYANPTIKTAARALGLVIDHTLPEFVILARDRAFSLAALTELARFIHRGVPVWITNPDASHPGPDGLPVPDTGALFAAVQAMVPGCRAKSLGKPSPDLLHLALKRAGVAPSQAIFVGDSPATDGLAAGRAGVPFVCLLPPGPARAAGAV